MRRPAAGRWSKAAYRHATAGNAYRALDETVSLSDAVRTAVQTAPPDTLIIVTADHSHTLNFVGYPVRGNRPGKYRRCEEATAAHWRTACRHADTTRLATPRATRAATRSGRQEPAQPCQRPAAAA
ncbi:alkaline phosphatase [Xanthomonas arboricola]|uniref:alkaline phosphatase n=1 Tax=Xanthomonas arboricola TaxID=56448 RepID=UPI003CE5882E